MTQSDDPAETGALEPELPIIDAHHHLWVTPTRQYLMEEYGADTQSGHNILASVYVECEAMYRRSGPEAMRSVGEAEFVAGMAAMSESGLYGPTRACAAFTGCVDLRRDPDVVDEVIDALAAASGGRLRGIRNTSIWNADPSIASGAPEGLLLDRAFQRGYSRLAGKGLLYETWQYHPQLGDVWGLADAFPDTPLIVAHCGGLLGIGPYKRDDLFEHWKTLIVQGAERPNVLVKLGGLAPKRTGFAFDTWEAPPTARQLADLWRPYIETCIEAYGPERCMFESNFDVDRAAGSFRSVWNAFKLITAGASATDKAQIYCETARNAYSIALD